MPQKSKKYDNQSISSLKGADRVRKRPGVIFGSAGLEGCQHAMFEILSNSIDEAREGYGSKIVVTRYEDHSIEVEDFGRGIPIEYNEAEERYNWELVFCELYAGGKYSSDEGDNYQNSIGLNGLGLCATQYASAYMDVTVCRDGFRFGLHFEKGEIVGNFTKTPLSRRASGTRIRWMPDLEVFTEINIPTSHYLDIIKRQAVVNPNIRFIFRDQKDGKFETVEFMYEDGISEYVREIVGEEALVPVQFWQTSCTAQDRSDKPEYPLKINAAVTFSNKVRLTEYYHNSSWLEYGGVPDKAVRLAFVAQLDAYLKQKNKYKKGDSKITFADIEDCLVVCISSFCGANYASYENQTKKSLTNKGIQNAMVDFFKHQLEVYFIENPADAEKIAAQVLINKQVRESSDTARLNLKKKLSGSLDATNRVAKFVDCRTKDTDRRELYIVEGDSALGACKQSRNPDFQAIIPIRGKILNCLKADYKKIFKSEIITDLIKVLGCGVQVDAKGSAHGSSFDLDALRWNKVIICTDADFDGFQIRTLVLTMLYQLTPALIEEGKVYIAESPLYEITSRDKTFFAYSEAEKDKYIGQLSGTKYTLQRSKGLGENEADMMSLTTMNPETRRLIKVLPSEAELTSRIFDMLLGDDLPGRKDYIAQNGHLYLSQTDVS